ncbi:MAG: CRISPR system precrRNA processing endoribonuclease RAMP protein Cas6 [Fervidicoccaceae archaeon]
MITQGILSLEPQKIFQALIELESCLAEHYSTKQRTVFINYDNNREPALTAKAKYIVIESENKCEEIVKRTLQTARIYGIGASRANGFGTITIETKANTAK